MSECMNFDTCMPANPGSFSMPVGGCAYWGAFYYSLVQGRSPLKPFAVLPAHAFNSLMVSVSI